MLMLILKGILIGLLVSSPMGPIGMLCVQRTLTRGRWHGLATGLGAAVSDMVYALIILLGLSIISDFIDKNEQITLIIGSVILILFGIKVFRTNPIKNWTPDTEITETRYKRDFISAFLFTFSNIAIIFVFITLFARFNFDPVSQGGWFYFVIGLIAICLGAFIWWFFLTTLLSRMRKYVSRNGLKMLNRLIGSILILIGVVGLVFETV